MSERKKRIYQGELIGTAEMTAQALSLFQSQFWKLAGMQRLSPLTLTNIDTDQYRAMGVVRLDPSLVNQIFIQEELVDGKTNRVPNNVAVALLGLAEDRKGKSVHYYKSKLPTTTKFEFRDFSEGVKEIRTTHHAAIFNSKKPFIFDLSLTGRIIARIK